jgi:hypothetical protein
VTSSLPSIVPVWVIAVIGAVLVGVLAHPSGVYGWLGIVLVVSVILTFVIQLALPTKQGLVMRTAASIGGAVIVLAVATGILVLAGA